MIYVNISHDTFSELLSCKKITLKRIVALENCCFEIAFKIMQCLLENGVIKDDGDGVFDVTQDKEIIYKLKFEYKDWIEDFSEEYLKDAANKLPENSIIFLKFIKVNPGLTLKEIQDTINNGDFYLTDCLLDLRFIVCADGKYYCALTKDAWQRLGFYIGTNIPKTWINEMAEAEKLLNESTFADFGDFEDKRVRDFANELIKANNAVSEIRKLMATMSQDDEIKIEKDDIAEAEIYDQKGAAIQMVVRLQDTPYDVITHMLKENEGIDMKDYFADSSFIEFNTFNRKEDLIDGALSTFELITKSKNIKLNFFSPIINQAKKEIDLMMKSCQKLKFNCTIVLI